MTPRLLAAVTALAITATAALAQQSAPAAGFRADLAAFRTQITNTEKSYTASTRAAALARLAVLEGAADTLGAKYFQLEVARIAALADNGHSNANAVLRSGKFNRIPLRVTPFGEDFYVLRAKGEYAELLGARVVAIDGVPIATVRTAGRTLTGGTTAWRDRVVPFFLESPEQMRMLGTISRADSVTYRFERADGRTVERRIIAEPADSTRLRALAFRWMTPVVAATEGAEWQALLTAEKLPWSLQDFGTQFRWRDAPDLSAFLIEFRANRDAPARPIAPFLAEMEAELKQRQPRNVVLDMRMNGGGDLNTTRNFMRLLPTLVPGRVFVLTSPWTFSAAISSVGYLKQTAPDRVTIVGEMVGDRLEFWAEGGPTILASSGIMIGTSRERHDYANGCAAYTDCHGSVVRNPIRVASFAPAIVAPWTIAAYRAGRDPGIEAIANALKSPRQVP